MTTPGDRAAEATQRAIARSKEQPPMPRVDPRTAPWRAVAGLALLRAQVQALADAWDGIQPGPTDYGHGASDAFRQAGHELRELLGGAQ